MADQGEIVSPQVVEEDGALIRRIALIALLSVAVGFVIQGLILAAKLWGGADNATAGFAASLAQGVTWSVLVCVGVGIVTSVSKARPLLAGLLALLVAPLALALAKASQKVVAGLISAAEQEAALSLGMASSLKAVEYGVLGWLLAKLVQRSETRAGAYLGTGAGVGIVFGGAIAWFAHQAALTKGMAPGGAQVAAGLINEVVFPVGCAMVIYAGQLVGRSARLIESQRAPAG